MDQDTGAYRPQERLQRRPQESVQSQGEVPAQSMAAPQPQSPDRRRGRSDDLPQVPYSPRRAPDIQQNPRQQGAQPQERGAAVPPQRRSDQENVEALLRRMEDNVSSARKVPFSEQVMLDRDEMLFLIKMIRDGLPEEIRQARWLLQKNRQLIAEARKEAENIMREGEQQMARMIDEHEVTQQAQNEARRILDEASAQSRQIHQEAMEYARNLLAEIEDQLTEMLVYIQKNKKGIEN